MNALAAAWAFDKKLVTKSIKSDAIDLWGSSV